MEAAEIEFLAERDSVKIVPNFSQGVIYLLQGDVGPFKAGIPTSVPLWMAVNLRRRQKCRIVQPDWMDLEKLEDIKDRERETPFFTEMPVKNAFVVSQLILDVATTDLVQADEIRTVLKDIWDIRQSKLRKSVDAFVQSGMLHAKLDHLHLIELNTVRPLLPNALNQIHKIEVAGAAAVLGSSSSSQQNESSRGMNNTMY